MTPEMALSGVASILGGGVLSAVLVFWASMRRTPIERTSAHAAASSEIADAATELLAPLREEVHRLRDELTEYREEAKLARRDAEQARQDALVARREAEAMRSELTTLRRIAEDADDYIGDLHKRWPHHRQQDRPPPWRWIDATD